jgi:Spy/CpxP family protein refolding chaperone
MKKIFIAATAILLATASLQAQAQKEAGTEKHHRGAYGHRGGMKGLNLNDEQKKQFKEIGETYKKQFADLKNNKSLSADELKTKAEALRKQRHEKMQSLLTPEQKTKMA